MSSLQIKNNHNWRVVGALEFGNLAAVEKQSQLARKSWQKEITIDFSALEAIDSAGIAWILENIAEADRRSIRLQLVCLKSDQANLLSEIQGVCELIEKYCTEAEKGVHDECKDAESTD